MLDLEVLLPVRHLAHQLLHHLHRHHLAHDAAADDEAEKHDQSLQEKNNLENKSFS
jgi:hypothetical protein